MRVEQLSFIQIKSSIYREIFEDGRCRKDKVPAGIVRFFVVKI
jgi:hypothetical protein